MSLGERIQQLRKTGGLSQEQLADKLNVSRQAISKWETDQSSPEIENILALSRVFSISTDELLGSDAIASAGASEVQAREAKPRFSFTHWAKRMVALIDRKVCFIIFTLLCFIAVGTCVIVNYALNQQITWAAYPIASVALGWLMITPLIYRKYIISLCVTTAIAVPFLYVLNIITPAPDWFSGLGIPLAIVGVATIWIVYLLFRYVKISLWYKAAITVLVAGVANMVTDCITNGFLGTEQPLLLVITQIFSCVAIAVLLGITGYIRKKAKTTENRE